MFAVNKSDVENLHKLFYQVGENTMYSQICMCVWVCLRVHLNVLGEVFI